MLWKHHDRETLEKAWGRAGVRHVLKEGVESPLAVFDLLRNNAEATWVTRRSCAHGDLNATKVAVDHTPPDRPKGFIFDASGVHADVATRGLRRPRSHDPAVPRGPGVPAALS